MSGQAGRYQRSSSGMVGAMVILLVVIGAYVGFRALNRNQPDNPVRPVDYEQTASFARRQADFPLLAPVSLPSGWMATSVDYQEDPTRWHLGVLTDEDEYIGLEQSRAPVDSLVETYVDREARRTGGVQVAGGTWSTWSDAGGDTALVRREEGVTTLVVGTPDLQVLEDYAASLR